MFRTVRIALVPVLGMTLLVAAQAQSRYTTLPSAQYSPSRNMPEAGQLFGYDAYVMRLPSRDYRGAPTTGSMPVNSSLTMAANPRAPSFRGIDNGLEATLEELAPLRDAGGKPLDAKGPTQQPHQRPCFVDVLGYLNCY